MDMVKIGYLCKQYRLQVLKLSLTEFSKLSNENLKNIHAFESGRANNIKYLYMYMKLSTITQLEVFINSIFFDVIRGGNNGI